MLNTIVAESIDDLCDRLEQKLDSGSDLNEAVAEVVARHLRPPTSRSASDGEDYIEEWYQEAEKRAPRTWGPRPTPARVAGRAHVSISRSSAS